MFDVYLNVKRDRLLVIARGQPLPFIEKAGRWRKKKGTDVVSHEIKSAVQRDGFYCRRLGHSNSLSNKTTVSPVAARLSSRNDIGYQAEAGGLEIEAAPKMLETPSSLLGALNFLAP